MDYWVEKEETGFVVYAGDRLVLARTTNLRDAALVRQSLALLEGMARDFPGIINGEDDVNGGDLVEFFNAAFEQTKTLHGYLGGDGEFKQDEEIYNPDDERCDHDKLPTEECSACEHDRYSDGITDGARL